MPNSTLQQPVHRNWQPNEPVQPNRAVSGRDSQLPPASQENSHGTRNLSVEYMRRTQSQTANLCYVPTSNRPQAADFTALKENLSDFDTQQATTSDSHVYGDELASMSFQNLLALADGGNEAAIQNVISEKNFVAEGGKKLEFGAPSSSLCGPHENSGPWGPGDLPRQTLNEEPGFASLGIGTNSIPSMSCFDLNIQLGPVTPQKTDTVEYHQQKTTVIGLTIDKALTRKEAQNKAEKSRPPLLVDQSPSATSTQLEENHKPDKGGTKEADLTKTPQQKAKRKKHRPKVVIEDHKKRIPNSVKKPTESTDAKRANTSKKAPTSTGTLTGKRKYERIGVTKTESDVDKESTKMAELKTSRITRSSCRRTLDFNSDSRARGESSLKYPSSKWDGETRADNLDTQDGSKTLQFEQETTKKDVVASPSGCWDPQRQARGLKRQNVNEHVESEISDRNKTGKCSDFMQAYLPIFSQNANNDNAPPGMHFLVIYKKKRTEKGNSTGFSSKQRDIVNLPRISPANDSIQTGRKAYEDLLALLPIERIRKKRSKSSTRRRDLASLMDICRQLPASTKQAKPTRMKQKIAILHEPSTCMEALVADTPTVLKTKKRTKRSMLANPMLQNSYNHQKSATMQMGPPLSLTWRITSPVDLIMEQLRQLNLNVTSQTSEEKWNPYMGCHSHNQEQRGLVPFQRSDDLIPFDGTFDDVRRKQPRPKVKLNGETTKVWKLLLDNIQREGIDGTNEEKEKWWDEERRLFSGRTASFIMRTRLVLADRSFSRWKGSVVDSVVGVFLTQNVSDNLSSSAFMSLAARFPLKSKTEPAELYEEKRGTEDHCELDHDWAFGLNNGISTKSVNGDRLQVFHGDRIIEVYNVNSDGFFQKDELGAQSPNASKRDVGVSRETDENMSMSLIEDGRDAEDVICSSTPEISSQNSSNSPTAQTTERIDSGLPSTSQEESKACAEPNGFESSTSFVKLLQMAGTVLHGNCEESGEKLTSDVNHRQCESGDLTLDLLNEAHLDNPMHPAETISPSTKCTLCKENSHFFKSSTNKNLYLGDISELSSESASGTAFHKIRDVHSQAQRNLTNIANHCSNANNSNNPEHTEINTNKNDFEHFGKTVEGPKVKGKRPSKETEARVDWDELRKQAHSGGKERARTANTMDSVDWEAVRCADVNEIAQTIKDRGMSNMLGERIKDFLNRLVRDHGSIDLEWLRDVPPDKAKEYLLSIRGLGLKSVECVRLLELRHDSFPVDTNVARIAVRLGWVPLQPLPESLQLHLLEMYPVLDSIQKYLWPRLCKLDQGALYELHYLMITFGKVFCTKSKPNCKECPMKGECRHFASACASARLSLPAPDGKSIVSATENTSADQNPMRTMHTLQLPSPEASQMNARFRASNSQPIIEEPPSPEPIIEVPATPEQDYAQVPLCDIENHFNEDPDEIPTIELNMEEFTLNLQKIIEQNADGNMSKALVALSSTTASIPVPKLKNVNRLRTEHQVYELPDSHPLLEGMDKREPDDPCPYLFGIWTPGETVNSIEPPQRRCSSIEFDKLCRDDACSSCNSIREAESQTVRGTFLIPCRTAMRGSFPLNGTYFQVNEVFSDHESSLSPMAVPREWLWNLRKRTVYFGTSIPTIFKGMTIEDIQHCFWRGYVCVRGFDRKTRAPRPLIAKLHFPASRLSKGKVKMNEN